MATPVSLMDDQMVDMAFITQLTGLTDKWFYKRRAWTQHATSVCAPPSRLALNSRS
ncbi:Rha family transcriptional regulator [Escherichia coli]|uniref:Rha family transcriptional regulator n=1 Tax=Escherichia coli TaxID=562 RepID=UPI00398C3154